MAPAQMATIQNVDGQGVGLSGSDPVAFFTEGQPVKGNPQYQSHYANYGGATYYFASAKNKALFDENPEKYAPQYGGYCATAMSMGKLEEIQVNFFVIHNDRLLMQHNNMAKMVFLRNPDERLAAAHGPLGSGEDAGQAIWTPDGETKFALTFVDNESSMGTWASAGNALAVHTMNEEQFTISYSVVAGQ